MHPVLQEKDKRTWCFILISLISNDRIISVVKILHVKNQFFSSYGMEIVCVGLVSGNGVFSYDLWGIYNEALQKK